MKMEEIMNLKESESSTAKLDMYRGGGEEGAVR